MQVQRIEILINAGDGDVELEDDISDFIEIFRWRPKLDTSSYQRVPKRVPV